jgi:hypothetical protein
MNIEKHHLSGLTIALQLIETSVDSQAIKSQLLAAIQAAEAAQGLSYQELEQQFERQTEELEHYHELDRQAEQEHLMAERTERIVDILFPNYPAASMKKENYPIRHPDKEWWWNGASLIWRIQLKLFTVGACNAARK